MHAVPTRVCKLHVSRYVSGRRTTRVPAHVRAHVCVRTRVQFIRRSIDYMSFSSFAAYGTAGLPRGKPLGRCRTSPPGRGGGLIPVANRRGAVDAKIDVGRNKELRLLTPASRRWVRRLNNPFCALPVPLQLCGVCPSKEPFACRHPRMPC